MYNNIKKHHVFTLLAAMTMLGSQSVFAQLQEDFATQPGTNFLSDSNGSILRFGELNTSSGGGAIASNTTINPTFQGGGANLDYVYTSLNSVTPNQTATLQGGLVIDPNTGNTTVAQGGSQTASLSADLILVRRLEVYNQNEANQALWGQAVDPVGVTQYGYVDANGDFVQVSLSGAAATAFDDFVAVPNAANAEAVFAALTPGDITALGGLYSAGALAPTPNTGNLTVEGATSTNGLTNVGAISTDSLTVGGVAAATVNDVTTGDNAVRGEFAAADDAVRGEFAAADNAVRGEFAAADNAVRGEFAAADNAVRGEFAAADDAVRGEFAAADNAVRGEFAAADNVVRGEFAAADAGLQAQITAEVNTRDSLIRQEANGIHIGPYSLVTDHIGDVGGVGGQQALFAEDINGDAIDIRITNGSNLVVDGTITQGGVLVATVDDVADEASRAIARENQIETDSIDRDVALGLRIDDEAAIRLAADTQLQANIDAEALARSNQDIVLGQRIDTLDTRVTTEVNRLDGRIDVLDGRTGALEGRMNNAERNIRSLRKGIAMAAALQTPVINSGDKMAVKVGAATYDGEQGLGVGFAARVGESVTINVDVATGFPETVARGGVNLSF